MNDAEVLAYNDWPTNAHLIEDVARLGYITGDVLDPTFGLGRFWKRWHPDDHGHKLHASDLNPMKSPGKPADFTKLPHDDETFDTVVLDPPYKLNGTPACDSDDAYGVNIPTRWQDRMTLLYEGTRECARVLKSGGHLLVKCQDQVCSGKVRWQTHEVARVTENAGHELVDCFHMLGGRPQPAGRRQVHARRNASTLLVFRKVA